MSTKEKLYSVWGESLDEKKPLTDYPRMHLQRQSYMCLNGVWEYQITARHEKPVKDGWKKIVVPFAPGTTLSGTDENVGPDQELWYRRQFAYKPSIKHTILHFGAVDQECVVYVNGIEAGGHGGGYVPFSLDISPLIKYQNTIVVKCVDLSDQGAYMYGKQKMEHGGMWYTPSAGIWQTVWLEDIPEHAVTDIKITPDYDNHLVAVDLAGDYSQALISVVANDKVVHQGLTNDLHYTFELPDFRPWSPDDPFLYDLYVKTEDDLVKSYFGMRKFSAGYDKDGVLRFCLNEKPLFLSGVLDQGYTVDGGLTYESDEAMIADIQKMKDMGFNMLRKHVKVEAERWYYHCDRLGMLVMQDIPNSGGPYSYPLMTVLPHAGLRKLSDTKDNKAFGRLSEDEKGVFEQELDEILDCLYHCTCIFAWTLFNEGWGQYESARLTEHIKNYDQSRLVDSASGWHDQGAGDFESRHVYFTPFHVSKKKRDRILLLSEFGGYAYLEYGHSQAEKLYGYKTFTDKVALDEAVNKLFERFVLDNIRNGLSGCVYTQVSDIEDECNGILTADRKVVKLDERRMRKMNERCIRKVR